MQHSSELFEDEGIERVGADVALGAAPMLTAGARWVMIIAVVIVMVSTVASTRSMTVDCHAAMATLEHRPQKPSFIIDPAWMLDGMNLTTPPIPELLPSNFTDLLDFTMLEGVGHWSQLEAPDATNAALLAFLESF